MSFISSIIVVDDVIGSRDLYENILKMKVVEDHGIYNVGFEGGLALYKKTLFQELTDNIPISNKPNSFVLYFEVGDINGLEKTIKGKGFEFIHEVREQPWAQRVFRFYDLDGHILEIAEKMNDVARRLSDDDKTVEDISGITGLPVERIRQLLESESQ